MNCEHYIEPQGTKSTRWRAFCKKKKIYVDPAICDLCGQKETRSNEEEETRKEKNMADSMFEIKRNLGILSRNERGWVKALTLTSWNGNPAKLDIREWNEDYTRCSKGVTFTDEEAKVLKAILDRELEEDGTNGGE